MVGKAISALFNSGIIWLHGAYPDWQWLGMDMFHFSHSYLAKFAALFAMFLMALVLFELLPKMHAHVLKLMQPIVGKPKNASSTG